ncbi:MAG TPA: cyclodeaminase/cyclohydrolase family protein [Candidatus Polarisedimenticolia bacterium]|nr:cyclodeaminase/cyclohydrolase family protein [Candidatus Polarisedimenticolia bacterium]
MLVDLKLKEFSERLAAATPTPGGGSASALAASLAASLGAMVCDLTVGKPKYEAARADLEKAREALQGLRKDLLALVDRDAEAYDQVAAAMKLPKGTPEEKAKRQEVLGRASLFATEIPLKTAESSLAVLKELKGVAEKGNASALSDVGVAAHLAHTGLVGAALNVRTNLPGIPDRERAGRIVERTSSLESEAAGLLEELRGAVSRRMSG